MQILKSVKAPGLVMDGPDLFQETSQWATHHSHLVTCPLVYRAAIKCCYGWQIRTYFRALGVGWYQVLRPIFKKRAAIKYGIVNLVSVELGMKVGSEAEERGRKLAEARI